VQCLAATAAVACAKQVDGRDGAGHGGAGARRQAKPVLPLDASVSARMHLLAEYGLLIGCSLASAESISGLGDTTGRIGVSSHRSAVVLSLLNAVR
jgi:hypothetical protein